MFVQVTKCKHGQSTYLTYLVRESFRTAAGPRSRTVCNITSLPPHTRDLIAQSLQGRSFVAPETLDLPEALEFRRPRRALPGLARFWLSGDF